MDNTLHNIKMKQQDEIDITSSWEVIYWQHKLECTLEELFMAEREVGKKINKIRESISLTRKGSSK